MICWGQDLFHAPEICECDITGAGNSLKRTRITGRAGIQALNKSLLIRVVCRRAYVFCAVIKGDMNAIRFPAIAFITKRNGYCFPAVLLLQCMQIVLPDPWGRCAVTNQILHDEMVIVLSQIGMQSCNLTGCAAEINRLSSPGRFVHTWSCGASRAPPWISRRYVRREKHP